jgi:hypothetical protein
MEQNGNNNGFKRRALDAAFRWVTGVAIIITLAVIGALWTSYQASQAVAMLITKVEQLEKANAALFDRQNELKISAIEKQLAQLDAENKRLKDELTRTTSAVASKK